MAAVGDVGVGEPGFVPGFSVEGGGLDVEVFFGVVFCLDDEGFAVAQAQGDFVEDGGADGVVGAGGVNGVKSHGAEDVPG